jgi:HD-GYP domain-containing protein (c-di-GMP phosphodiesterase class II)
VDEIAPGSRFPAALFHRDGTPLLIAHARADAALLRALREAGVEEVFLCRSREAALSLRESAGMREVDVKSLGPGPVTRSLYDEAGELVCGRGQALTDGLLGNLARRGEVRLYEERSDYEAVRERFEEALARAVAETLGERMREEPGILRVEPAGEPFARRCRRPSPRERTAALVEEKRGLHAATLASVHGLLERARREGRLDLFAAQALAEKVLVRLEEDLPLTLALADSPLHHDYLVDHSLAVAVHVSAMGVAAGYGRDQCAELALAGLVHDVGMALVKEEVLRKDGPLTPEEIKEIRSHPGSGLALASRTPGVPMTVPFAVFQDHERPDGRGYPTGVTDGWIHDHAKLIAVADCYQAMTAPRP